MRVENLVLNVPARQLGERQFGEFLEFETLTLCPIDTRCIDPALLRADEIAWLNGYHATVAERLAPGLCRRGARLAAAAHGTDLTGAAAGRRRERTAADRGAPQSVHFQRRVDAAAARKGQADSLAAAPRPKCRPKALKVPRAVPK